MARLQCGTGTLALWSASDIDGEHRQECCATVGVPNRHPERSEGSGFRQAPRRSVGARSFAALRMTAVSSPREGCWFALRAFRPIAQRREVLGDDLAFPKPWQPTHRADADLAAVRKSPVMSGAEHFLLTHL